MVESDKAGKADINRELMSPQNDRFILHDSRGFEPGEGDNYNVAKNFIQSRKSEPDIRNQLHAIWYASRTERIETLTVRVRYYRLCFQVPLVKHGERLMDRSTEQFLKEKRKIVGDSELMVVFCSSVVSLLLVPTIVVFTKYDRLVTMMKAKSSTGYESEATRYLDEHCIQPIQKFTDEIDISHIAVSCEFYYGHYYFMLTVILLAKQGQETGRENLMDLTFTKVSQHFTPKMGAPSPVPVVTMMAQRISPGLKIQGSIE